MAANHAAILRQNRHSNQPPISDLTHSTGDNVSLSLQLDDDVSIISSNLSAIRGLGSNNNIPDALSTTNQSSSETHSTHKLDKIETVDDINYYLNINEHYETTIAELKATCNAVTNDLSKVLDTLRSCVLNVTDASAECLDVLSDRINVACNEVDEGIKASYKLIATCDSVATQLESIVQFKAQVKALRKSIESLEILYHTSKYCSA